MPLLASIAVAAALTAWLLTPVCVRVARRLGVVDRPDVRKSHRTSTPYLGGVAVLGGVLAAVGLWAARSEAPAYAWARLDGAAVATLLGAVAIFALGLADDFRPVRARYKMLAQVAVAVGVWSAGVRFESIPLFDGSRFEMGCAYLSLPLTVLWIVGVTNALNLIDGLDGLAAGVGLIAAAAIAYVAAQTGSLPVACVLTALSAALAGFLYHNRHPAKIFLGDAGSLLIGFLLATCAVTTASSSASFLALGAPVVALAMPILDLTFTVLRRMIERRGVFSPDRNHVHYRLMSLGFSHGATVGILWFESAALTLVAVLLLGADAPTGERVAAFAVVVIAHVVFFRAAGAVRLRDSVRAFAAATARLREARARQRESDDLDLLFQRARTMDDWWAATESAAKTLGCTSLRLELRRRDDKLEVRSWRHPRGSNANLQTTLELPDRRASSGPLRLHVGVANESLETAAGRVALLSKLLDRHSVVRLHAGAVAPASRRRDERAKLA